MNMVQSEEVNSSEGALDLGEGMWIGTVTASINEVVINKQCRWVHTLQVGRSLITVKLDTGAEANLLNVQEYRGLPERPTLRPANVRLSDYNGASINDIGSCVLRVSVKGKEYPVRFVVVDNGPSLLGSAACERLGLVKRVDSVQQCRRSMEDAVADTKHYTIPEVKGQLSALPFVHKIVIKEGARPVIRPARRVPISLRESLREELDRMEKLGVIHRQEEPTDWVSDMVVVKKSNGALRVCLDPKDLNTAISREHYQLPTRDEIFAEISGATHFSKLDASQAFWQVKLSEDSKALTAFNTPFGRYAYDRLAYGLCSAPEVFHRTMEQMFGDLEGVRVFMDDILVWGPDETVHQARLDSVKQRINKYGLLMNWEKCRLNKSEITFIGETLSNKGISPSPEIISAIMDMKKPTSKEDVQRALGSINYVGKFIPNLANKCVNLRSLLCKKVMWNWGPEHESEWADIKSILASMPVMAYYDPKLPTKVSTDSSKDGLGAVLLQWHNPDWKPVAYGARGLTECEQRYAQIEKECLGLVYGCEKFHGYIYGLEKVTLETDHKPLIPLSKKPLNDMTPRIQRLMLKLQRYRHELVWTPGKHLYIADTLSRANRSQGKRSSTEVEVEAQVNMVYQAVSATQAQLDKIATETCKDEVLSAVKNNILNGWENGECPAYAPFREDLCIVNGLILKGDRIIIPVSMRKEMLKRVHEGHLGIEKQKRVARDAIYWPNMNRDIEESVQGCSVCQKYRPAQGKESFSTEEEKIKWGPWEKVGADLFHWEGNEYLICIDYYSNYPEITMLASTSSETVVTHLKSMFSRHGIPQRLVTDNGPQFSSERFKQFARDYQFEHRTSSPRYPQSNGHAERGVGIVKSVLNKAKEGGGDLYLALLAYRAAPRETGMSPGEMLMGRKLSTRLPKLQGRSKMTLSDVRGEAQRNRQIENYNATAKDLPVLNNNDVVRVRKEKWDTTARVSEQVGPRSYVVQTQGGNYIRRNRRHLLKVNEGHVVRPAEGESVDYEYPENEVGENMGGSDEGSREVNRTPQKVNNAPPTPRSVVTRKPVGENPTEVRRSGRIRRPVVKLDI